MSSLSLNFNTPVIASYFTQESAPTSLLTREILANIFSHLAAKDCAKASQVCRIWNEAEQTLPFQSKLINWRNVYGKNPQDPIYVMAEVLEKSLAKKPISFLKVQRVKFEHFPNIFYHMRLSIKSLEIVSSHISDLPTSFSGLTNLEHLNLSRNHFRKIPAEIFTLTHLKFLNIASKGFQDQLIEIPKDIGKLTNLTSLDISVNVIQILPATMQNLVKLKCLFLHENPIKNLPEWIKKLAQADLQVLTWDGKTPDDIAGLIAQRRISNGLPEVVQPAEYNKNKLGADQVIFAD